jgi:protein-tyrosine phosphatase
MDAVVAARADTEPDGSLLVTWELGGDPAAVDIATGATPDHLDHLHETTVPAGQTSYRLTPSVGRRFVSVAPHGSGPAVVTADRRIAFRGITNFRDLGGYRTGSGAVVRWGKVFRSDALHGLEPDDLDRYQQLGLRTVFDLRGDAEREVSPNPVASRHLKVLSRPADAAPLVPPTDLTAEAGEKFLGDMYRGLIDHAAEQIGELFGGLLDVDGLPAVFHCHAGKDRTGVVAALLLEALGVSRSVILDDYELTSRYRLRSQQDSTYEGLLRFGLSPEAAGGVLTTPRWAMEEALGHLDAQYSGVESYLTGPAGMDDQGLEALRARLLTSDGPE